MPHALHLASYWRTNKQGNTINEVQPDTAALAAFDLTKSYSDGEQTINVLRGASLSIAPGERVAIVGRSGSGKSTLLHMLAGLDTPDAGRVLVGGEEMTGLSANAKARLRASHMGFVYQNHHLLPEFDAQENVAMPLRIAGIRKEEAESAALGLLEQVGLRERRGHLPAQLSGGERQRVAVARAIAGNPSIVLADEPTGNLDTENANSVMALITELSLQHGVAFLIVTHDQSMLDAFDRVLELEDGQLVLAERSGASV